MAKMKFKDIIPDKRNTNKHTEFGMYTLDSSLEQVGIIESVTISNDNVIISGNARHEKIGQKFTKDAIIVETDGTTPVVIKRTDIKSGTKEFHKASILANTVAQKNQNIDVELVEVIANEFDFEVEEVFVELVKYNNDDIDLDSFFEENNEQKEQKNKITLEYTNKEFELVNEAFKKHSGSKEQTVFKLLGL